MAKKDTERHTHFISVVFKEDEGERVRAAADREHMKVSAWLRKVVMERLDSGKRGKK